MLVCFTVITLCDVKVLCYIPWWKLHSDLWNLCHEVCCVMINRAESHPGAGFKNPITKLSRLNLKATGLTSLLYIFSSLCLTRLTITKCDLPSGFGEKKERNAF